MARCRIYCACHQERRLSVQKWFDLVCFYHFDSKCASRHNGEHFFDSSTSKSAPTLTFSFRNVLRATIACTFSTAQLPKVFRHSNVFGILTWKRASRHSRVTFARLNFQNCSEHELPHASAPAALASLFFDPLEPQNIAKRQCLATSRLIAHFDLLSTDCSRQCCCTCP